jgi:hypothetical protein
MSPHDDGRDPSRIMNIVERIGIEEQKVSDFSYLHAAEGVALAEKLASQHWGIQPAAGQPLMSQI